ncbi:MAG: hypothetical protein GT589_02050 [Peptoclostridium sp.]|uniref:hypothetical protein n=1 Tax=Peptoclostridium sp. TaxID=1904860 RepID=UPI00139CEF6D|nr:hypothetical protein [Peptoclostridium sp.]MZQ74923.1 hypothetical protein [Peptoclostridium sp.]
MAGWGISNAASLKEKLKSEMADYLHGLNAVGEISYSTYSEMFDFGLELLDRMYELGKMEESKTDK